MNPTADYVPLIALPVEWEWALMKTGQILAIMILLLISLAFLLLFDRKVWAAVQLRKGPERRRPVRPASILRGLLQVRVQGNRHPGRREQNRVHPRAADDLCARVRRLGGGAVGDRMW